MMNQITHRRRRELSHLPQEHQAFLTSDHRNIVTECLETGSLQPPGTKLLTGVVYANQPLEYYRRSDTTPLSDTVLASISVLSLHPLYTWEEQNESDPDYNILLSGLMTMLSAHCTAVDLANQGFNKACREYNLSPVLTLKTDREIIDLANEAWDELSTHMAREGTLRDNQGYLIVVGFSIFLLIAKRLVTNSITHWFEARWRVIANLIARDVSPTSISPPVLSGCVALNTIVSSHHQLRASIFRTYRGLGSLNIGKYKAVFAVICRQLEYAEMNHIYLVFKYIYFSRPDVLAMTELMGAERSVLAKATAVLTQYSVHDRPFIKLIDEGSKLDPLHSRHFIKLTVAARAIASLEERSMMHYQTKTTPALDQFADRVRQHCINRSMVSILNASEATASMLNTQAGKRLLELGQQEEIDEPEFIDEAPQPRE